MRRQSNPSAAIRVIATCALISACATPDVSGELTALDESVSKTATELRVALTPGLQAERRTAQEDAIRNGRAVYDLPEACDTFSAKPIAVSPVACTPILMAQPVGPTTDAARKLGVLENYVAALLRLASAVDGDEISTAVAELSASFSKASAKSNSSGLADLAGRFEKRQEALGSSLGYWARQRQYAALRRFTTTSDTDVQRLLREILAVVDDVPGNNAVDEFERLNDATGRMVTAQLSGDPSRYRAAVREFENRARAWRAVAAASMNARLSAIGKTHSALAQRLSRGAGLDEVEAFLIQLGALVALTKPVED